MNSSIQSKLSSLGCNFALQEEHVVVDPEKVLIEALDYFWQDKKIFSMTVSLLKYRIHHLINTKRLYILILKQNVEKQALLRVVALKVFKHTGDERFAELEKKLKKKKVLLSDFPSKYCDEFYLKKWGIDKDFKKLGIKIAAFFEAQPERKLKPLRRIYKENEWLRLRAMSGPDYRADTLYLLKSGQLNTQSEVAQLLECNKSSVSRIWSSIKNIEDLVSVM